MKRHIYHIISILVALLVANSAWGQTAIKDTWAGGELTGSYKLTGNTTLTGTVSVSSGTLTIDLNGYTLDRKGTKAADFLFTVGETRTLNIMDSSPNKTGKITGGRGDRGGCALISGIFNFTGGEITNCIATDGNYGDAPTVDSKDSQHYLTQGCGGAFFVNSGATLNMSGTAKISSCRTENLSGTFGHGGAVFVAGTFNMTGGTITGCKASLGGAVYVFGGYKNTYNTTDTRLGEFNMSGGTIEKCGSDTHGSGVYTHGKVTISGTAKITECKPITWTNVTFNGAYPKVQEKDGYGSAIYAFGKDAVVTMSGGTLSNNLSSSGGAVMLWNESTMTMTGGTMDGNYAIGRPSLGNGGAVYLQTSTFNFYGGTLSNNTANRYGGAINTNQGATLVIGQAGSTCVISGNKASHGGGVSQEAGECSLTLASSGIDINNNYAHGQQSQLDGTISSSDGNGGGLFIEKGTLTFSAGKIRNNTATGHGGGAALYVRRIHGRTTKAEITGGEISGNSAKYGGGIDLYGGFKSLNDGDENAGKSNLIVNYSNGTLSNNTASIDGAGIYVSFEEAYTTATMTIGTASDTPVINNNVATQNGGGFGMTNQGIITVNNISASGNKAANGGAIWLGTGTFTIANGTLTNNTASQSGGGIYVGSGTFTVTGAATLKGNKATAQNGGGIYLGGGTFTVNASGSLNLGGTLQTDGNSAGNNGGGVFCGAPFTVNGTSTIQYNSAANGGGVYVNNGYSAKFAKETRLLNNSASGDGGGLYVTGGSVNLVQNTISNNHGKNGGAVYLTNGNVKATGKSTIQNNYSSAHGGAYYVSSGKVEMTSATITGNGKDTNGTATTVDGGAIYVTGNSTAFSASSDAEIKFNASTGNGGAIFLSGGNINIVGNTIEGNSATNGGAVYLDGGSVTAGASIIHNNYSTNNGGAYYVSGGSVTMTSATITGNGKNGSTVMTDNGGAVYVTGSGAGFTATGETTITSNAAKSDGGALYVSGGSISLKKNTNSSNSATNGGAIYVVNGGFSAEGSTEMRGNSAEGDGGAVYVDGGDIKITGASSVLTLSGNNAANGGVFYVNGGGITANGITKSTITNNYSTGDGGAFFVNNGNINLCVTDLSNNGKNSSEVKTVNGGAIALRNGVFSFANGSEIRNNAATGKGGGLYVTNASATNISCQGGSYLNNSAGLGGGIFADGPINLTFAANVRDNVAKNGGGLYLDNGVNMSFGNGLIVGNVAQVAQSASRDASQYGVGGGIYLAKGQLAFTATQNFGIYNNAASYEAADIYASGSNTEILLPNVKNMNLTGFDVPGSELYWVRDISNNRYEDALRDLKSNIDDMILKFEPNESVKTIKDVVMCLDLGYDLVFVTLKSIGLGDYDTAGVSISYNRAGALTEYRKVVFLGEDATVVGLPSGQWKLNVTPWSAKYNETVKLSHTLDSDGFVTVNRQMDPIITMTFTSKTTTDGSGTVIPLPAAKAITYDYKKVNKMVPGGSQK